MDQSERSAAGREPLTSFDRHRKQESESSYQNSIMHALKSQRVPVHGPKSSTPDDVFSNNSVIPQSSGFDDVKNKYKQALKERVSSQASQKQQTDRERRKSGGNLSNNSRSVSNKITNRVDRQSFSAFSNRIQQKMQEKTSSPLDRSLERKDLISKARRQKRSVLEYGDSIRSGDEEANTSIQIALGLDNNSFEQLKRKNSGGEFSPQNGNPNETADGMSWKSKSSGFFDNHGAQPRKGQRRSSRNPPEDASPAREALNGPDDYVASLQQNQMTFQNTQKTQIPTNEGNSNSRKEIITAEQKSSKSGKSGSHKAGTASLKHQSQDTLRMQMRHINQISEEESKALMESNPSKFGQSLGQSSRIGHSSKFGQSSKPSKGSKASAQTSYFSPFTQQTFDNNQLVTSNNTNNELSSIYDRIQNIRNNLNKNFIAPNSRDQPHPADKRGMDHKSTTFNNFLSSSNEGVLSRGLNYSDNSNVKSGGAVQQQYTNRPNEDLRQFNGLSSQSMSALLDSQVPNSKMLIQDLAEGGQASSSSQRQGSIAAQQIGTFRGDGQLQPPIQAQGVQDVHGGQIRIAQQEGVHLPGAQGAHGAFSQQTQLSSWRLNVQQVTSNGDPTSAKQANLKYLQNVQSSQEPLSYKYLNTHQSQNTSEDIYRGFQPSSQYGQQLLANNGISLGTGPQQQNMNTEGHQQSSTAQYAFEGGMPQQQPLQYNTNPYGDATAQGANHGGATTSKSPPYPKKQADRIQDKIINYSPLRRGPKVDSLAAGTRDGSGHRPPQFSDTNYVGTQYTYSFNGLRQPNEIRTMGNESWQGQDTLDFDNLNPGVPPGGHSAALRTMGPAALRDRSKSKSQRPNSRHSKSSRNGKKARTTTTKSKNKKGESPAESRKLSECYNQIEELQLKVDRYEHAQVKQQNQLRENQIQFESQYNDLLQKYNELVATTNRGAHNSSAHENQSPNITPNALSSQRVSAVGEDIENENIELRKQVNQYQELVKFYKGKFLYQKALFDHQNKKQKPTNWASSHGTMNFSTNLKKNIQSSHSQKFISPSIRADNERSRKMKKRCFSSQSASRKNDDVFETAALLLNQAGDHVGGRNSMPGKPQTLEQQILQELGPNPVNAHYFNCAQSTTKPKGPKEPVAAITLHRKILKLEKELGDKEKKIIKLKEKVVGSRKSEGCCCEELRSIYTVKEEKLMQLSEYWRVQAEKLATSVAQLGTELPVGGKKKKGKN